MNQRANTVADLAAVLLQEEVAPPPKTIEQKERRENPGARVKARKAARGQPIPRKNPLEPAGIRGIEGINIRWADMMDQGYAKEWPAKVEHRSLERSRYTAAFPAYEIADPGMTGPLEGEDSTPQQVTA